MAQDLVHEQEMPLSHGGTEDFGEELMDGAIRWCASEGTGRGSWVASTLRNRRWGTRAREVMILVVLGAARASQVPPLRVPTGRYGREDRKGRRGRGSVCLLAGRPRTYNVKKNQPQPLIRVCGSGRRSGTFVRGRGSCLRRRRRVAVRAGFAAAGFRQEAGRRRICGKCDGSRQSRRDCRDKW
jgi:hypothetical protein